MMGVAYVNGEAYEVTGDEDYKIYIPTSLCVLKDLKSDWDCKAGF